MPVMKKEESTRSLAKKTAPAPTAAPLGGDFTTSKVRKPQSIGVLIGEAGSGKSTFITRFCPGPIAYFHADGRADDAIEEARELRGDDIIQEVVINFPESVLFLSKERARAVAKDSIIALMNNLIIASTAAKRGDIKTIAFDTGFEINELFHIFARGDLNVTRDESRGENKYLINRQWLTIFEIIRGCGANFIVLDRAKQQWIDNAPIKGSYIPSLPPVASSAADWIGHISVDITPGTKKTTAEAKFEIKMLKSGPNHLELKKTYTSEQWESRGGPFAYLSSQVYPKVNRKVWMP